MTANTFPGMVFCTGDDAADEPMFVALMESVGRHMEGGDDVQLFTGTVGKKPSQAEFFFNAVPDVERFLLSVSRPET